MARSKSFKEFSKHMKVVADGFGKNVGHVIRQVAVVVDQVLVMSTPVDTGRARGAWLATVGAPTDAEGPLDKEGGSTITANNAVIETRRDDGGQSIFITNNVPYIVPLDNGTSVQAPGGMTAQAIQAAEYIVQRARDLL